MNNLFDWSDQTWLLLDQTGILAGDVLMLLSIAGAVITYVERNNIRRWLVRNRFPKIGGKPEHRNWRNIVFTVSKADVPLWVIDQLQPQAVGLLATVYSQDQCEAIERELQARNIHVSSKMIVNPDDPGEVHHQARALIDQIRNLYPGETAVDVTGGKTTMSLGAFMAAEETGVDSIYVSTRMQHNGPDMSSARIISISEVRP